MAKISVVINTLNEEAHLPDCLASISWADEIIVVDMHSTDRTAAIAQAAGAKVFQHERADYAEPARNFALAQAIHPWILVLDADERISPGLADFLKTRLDTATATAFRIPRRNYYGDRWITCCGWFPDEQLRLFRRGKAKYSGRIHRAPEIDGSVENLSSRGSAFLIHRAFNTLESRLEKDNKYSSIAAATLAEEGRKVGTLGLLARVCWTFITAYIFQGGFRFGTLGVVLACERAQAIFLKYGKLWERRRQH